jgi:hypothetical protein
VDRHVRRAAHIPTYRRTGGVCERCPPTPNTDVAEIFLSAGSQKGDYFPPALGPGRDSSPGPFWRGAHEETNDRMKSTRVGILILTLVICGAVKPRSTENLVASAAAAAEPKPPERATKVARGQRAADLSEAQHPRDG